MRGSITKGFPPELNDARRIVSQAAIAIEQRNYEAAVENGVALISEVKKLIDSGLKGQLARYSGALKRAKEGGAARLLDSILVGIGHDFIKDDPKGYIERGFVRSDQDASRAARKRASLPAYAFDAYPVDHRDTIRRQERGHAGDTAIVYPGRE